MKEKKVWTKWFYWFTFATAIILIYKTLDNFNDIGNWFKNFLHIVMPFIIGIIIAYILYTPARNVERLLQKAKKLKFLQNKARSISVIIVYIIALLILVLIINYLIPIVSASIIDFVNHFQDYYNIINDKINSLPDDSILRSEAVTNAVSQLGSVNISEYVNVQKLTEYAQGALSVAAGIFNFFVSIIVSAYLLLERGEILKFLRKLSNAIFEENVCKNVAKYFHNTNEIFLKFLASQLLDAIVVGILASIAMKILGVKYAILLGIMIGIFNMIPYFGAIIAVIIAAIITFITGGFSQAAWMIVIVTILQQIDANIINPKIVGESLKISPLLVIFAVTIGGAYFGVLGMFLAVPVVAVIKVLIGDFIEFRNARKDVKLEE
ncbi:MAG: AI-2E family transporter [Clostridia bacterium]|nr:AI-2E family transporter [Clostridia bacterium]